MRAGLSLALLAFFAAPLAAQSPSELRGRVLDSESGLPVAGADVAIAGLLVTTGTQGGFLFGSLDPGHYTLRIRRVGYSMLEKSLDVLPGLSQQVELRLTPRALELDTITVTARSSDGPSVTGDALRRRGQDLGRALDGWEGVTMRRGAAGSAEPQVRGGAPDEVLVILDGFPVNNPFTGRADLSRIPTSAVERVTLVPGAQGPREGSRAVSGVISIETRRHTAPQLTGAMSSYGGADVSAGASGGPVTVFASRSWLPDNFEYDVPPVRGTGQAERNNAGGGIWNLNGRLSVGPEITLRASASDRGLPGPVTNPTPTAQASDRSVLVGLRAGHLVEFRTSLQWLSARYSDESPPVAAPYSGSTEGLGVSASLGIGRPVRAFGLSGDVAGRIEGRHDRFSGDQVSESARFTSGALSFDGRLQPQGAPSITLSPVVRLDDWTDLGTPVVSARMDVTWRHAGSSVSVGYGNGITAPVLADLFFREGNGVRLNPDLRPERVRWELNGAVRQEGTLMGAQVAFSVRGFQGRVQDMVLWGLSPAYGFVWTPGNYDVRRRGGEVGLSLRGPHGVFLNGSGTIASVTRDAPNGKQMLYRPLGTAAADLVWQPGPWSFDVRWHYVGIRYPNSSGINPLPAFALLDAGIERRLNHILRLRGDVTDLTDTRAQFIAGFPSPGRTFTLTLTAGTP